MCIKCQQTADIHATYAVSAKALAEAAKTLYEINRQDDSNVLSAAAAEMFRVIEEPQQAEAPRHEGEAGQAGVTDVPVKGWFVDPVTGTCYRNGAFVGELVGLAVAQILRT